MRRIWLIAVVSAFVLFPCPSLGMMKGTATIGGQYLVSEEGISEIDNIPVGPASSLELALVGSLAGWTMTSALDMIYSIEKGPNLRMFRLDSSGRTGSITIGDYYENVSELTIGGTVMKGLKLELMPFGGSDGILKGGGMIVWGVRTRAPREPDPQAGIAASYARYLVGARGGLLEGEGPHISASAIYGWDDEASISNPGTLKPRKVGTAGIESFFPVLGGLLGLNAHLYLSSSEDERRDLASIAGLSLRPTKGTSISGFWKRIGTDFETLGNPYLDTDRDGFEMRTEGVGKVGSVTISGSLRLETFGTNLSGDPNIPKERSNEAELSGSLSSSLCSGSLTYRLIRRRGQVQEGAPAFIRTDWDTHWAIGIARIGPFKGSNISLIGQAIRRDDRSIPVSSSYSMYFGAATLSSELFPALSLTAYLSASSLESEAVGRPEQFFSGIGRIQWNILPSKLLLYLQGSASIGSKRKMEEIIGEETREVVPAAIRSRFRGSAEIRYYISLERAISLEYGFFRDEREDGSSYDGNMISIKLISGF